MLNFTIFSIFVLSHGYLYGSTNKEEVMTHKGTKHIKSYALTLQKRLKSHLRNNDIVSSIMFCNENADFLTQKWQKDHGLLIGRTSFKYRNPKNKPDIWMVPILKEFSESSIKKPMLPKYISNQNGDFVVKPIYMKKLCLNCHGIEINKNVKLKLKKLYPDDKAQNYTLGQFRGLFWLKLK